MWGWISMLHCLAAAILWGSQPNTNNFHFQLCTLHVEHVLFKKKLDTCLWTSNNCACWAAGDHEERVCDGAYGKPLVPGGKTPSSTVLLLLNKTTICFDRAPKNEDVAKDFVTKFNLELICRSHEVVEDGVAYFADRTVVTHGWIRLAPGWWTVTPEG